MTSVPRRPRTKVYIRESKAEGLAGYSPDEMIRQCRAKAAQLHSDVIEVVLEAGKRDELDCPGLLRLMDEAADGDYEYLISWDMYRLSGELAKHLWVKERFARTSVRLHYVTAEYPETAEGELMETLQGAVGRYERVKTRARTQNGINGKLELGRPICNGRAPYGLVKVRDARGKAIGYAPHDQTFPVLERIFRDLETLPYTAVAAALNAEGVPTPSGRGIWRPSTLYGIITNATYAGLYRWGRIKRTPARGADGQRVYRRERRAEADVRTFAIDAVLGRDLVAAAHRGAAERHRRKRRAGAEADDAFGLRGRVWCGSECAGLLSCGTNHGLRRYTCLRTYPPKGTPKTCTTPQLPAADLERVVWAEVERSLSDHAALEAALAAAADPGEAGRRWAEQTTVLDRKIAELDGRLSNAAAVMIAHPPGTTVHELTSRAATADEATKRELVRAKAEAERQAPRAIDAAEVAELRDLWERLAAGLAGVDGRPDRQRLLYAALGLRVEVRVVEDGLGVLVGQKHRCRVRVQWRGKVAADVSHSVRDPSGFRMLWDSHPDDGRLALRVLAA